jgi:hypothetical protein
MARGLLKRFVNNPADMERTPESSAQEDRLAAHFLELPGLRLTQEQAARLLGIDAPAIERVVNGLLDASFLRRMPDGTVVRADRWM